MKPDSTTLHLHIVDPMLKDYELPFKRVEQFAEDDDFSKYFDSFKIFETSLFKDFLRDNRITQRFINTKEFHLIPYELEGVEQSQYKRYLHDTQDEAILQSIYERLMNVVDYLYFYESRQLELWEDFVASKKEALSEQTDENDYLVD
jgi:hypothetical protein